MIKLRLLVCTLVLLIVASSAANAQRDNDSMGSARLRGTVYHSGDDLPAAGIMVTLAQDGNRRYVSYTNPKGEYEFLNVASGTYDVFCCSTEDGYLKGTGIVLDAGKITFWDSKLKRLDPDEFQDLLSEIRTMCQQSNIFSSSPSETRPKRIIRMVPVDPQEEN